jgi:RND superfamily putative drug exporter
MLARLAQFSFHKRKLMVFAIWVPILIGLSVISGAVKTDYHTSFTLPDSESKAAFDALKATPQNKADAGIQAQIVFTSTSPQGVKDPAVQAAMSAMFTEVAKLPGVTVVSPYAENGTQYNSSTKPISYASLSVTERTQSEYVTLADSITGLGDKISVPGLTIEYGGQVFQKIAFPASEVIGILAAIIILLFAFGSVVAMGLPIGTAVIGLGVEIGLLGVLSHGFSMPDFAPQMGAMIGLGVGIDYALFIVSRYREGLHNGLTSEQAVMEAIDSSGRAVLFAGITVMISLLGLMVMGLAFVTGLAIAGATSVLVMMVASLTLLPALLGFVGATKIFNTSRAAAVGIVLLLVLGLTGAFSDNIGLVGIGFGLFLLILGASFLPPFKPSMRTMLKHREQRKPREQQFWYRWSRMIQHKPWRFLGAGLILMVLLAVPFFSLRLGFSDQGALKTDQTARRAYDLIGEGFGPGYNGPLLLVSTDPAMNQGVAAKVDAALKSDPDIALAVPGHDIGNSTWLWNAIPKTSPQDQATSDLVARLRDSTVSSSAVGAKVLVGGQTAAGIDFADYLAGRLPILIGAVLILSFLLLMAVFRSLLVPLKAVVMNLLSIGAAYGVVVAVFQWGWLKTVIGIDKTGPIDAWVPMMLFAIVFGLSMDYEVFLLSRMKEEYDRTKNNATAVADGLTATARVITAAALIMVCVFSAFVFGDDRSIKLFGLGLAAAVFVDATFVRMLLVPATMELLGDRNWWIPKWLDKLLPKIDVEGHSHTGAVPTDDESREPELV